MRRSLLTVAQTTVAPLSVGVASPGSGSTFAYIGTVIETVNAATASGTLTSVSAYFTQVGSVAFLTGSLSGSTYTVRSVSSTFSAGLNLQTFSVSLPVQKGDFIAVWMPSSGGAGIAGVSGGSCDYQGGPSSKPGAGSTISSLSLYSYTIQVGGK